MTKLILSSWMILLCGCVTVNCYYPEQPLEREKVILVPVPMILQSPDSSLIPETGPPITDDVYPPIAPDLKEPFNTRKPFSEYDSHI